MEKAYCVKCRTKREMLSPKTVNKSGRQFLTGKCKVCGTSMWRILGLAKK
jgi:hypothetical protein